jgi:hypothetical protein
VYFEGYANSYEEAEYILEQLSDEEFDVLCENVFRSRDTGAVNADADERAAEMHKTVSGASHTSSENRKRHRDAAAQHLVSARRKRRKAKTNEEYVYENVSGGRGRRASSRRAPISQRVSDSEAREIRRNARENPKPTASAPEDDSLEAMKLRFRAETDAENAEKEAKKAKKAKKPTTVPSRGVEGDEPVLRRKTPEGHGKRGASPVAVAKRRARLLSTGQDPTQRYTYSRTPTPESKARAKKIRAALKKRDKWGTPEAAKEEYVIDYLVTEGYTDNYDSAIAIYESMSEEWLDTILEVKGRGRVLMRSTRDASERGMKITPERKLDLKLAQLERQYPGDGSLGDLENIEQRIQKMRTVKDTPSMRKRVDNVRNITKRYKR